MRNVPNVWGEGNIFAFSGFEGKTDWSYPFVGTLLKDKIGFTIRTEREKTFWVDFNNSGDKFTPDMVASDVISIRTNRRENNLHILMLPFSKNEIKITITPEKNSKATTIYLCLRVEACKKLFFGDGRFTIMTDKDEISLFLNGKADIYNVVDSMDEVKRIMNGTAKERAKNWDGDKEVRYLVVGKSLKKEKPLTAIISNKQTKSKKKINTAALIRKRQNFFVHMLHRRRNTTLVKAFDILKANVESPQGVFKQRWTTPDRWPHRHLWLWDSCFHSLGLVYIDGTLAEDSLLSVLDIQQESGFIPHIGRPDGNFSNITQPPLLSWAVWKVYQHTKNKDFLKKCYPKLRKYLLWCFQTRDKNRNGLLEWKRNDESGLDNSSRFNNGCGFDAIDFSCFLVNDLQCLTSIGKEIGKEEPKFENTAKRITEKIQNYLWDRKAGFFFDRYLNGGLSTFKTACGFLPLFAGIANKHQAERLLYHLGSKNEFSTPFPVPSEAIDSPTFDNNMWRGPVWLNYNYFIIQGLIKYGLDDIAQKIRQKTLREVQRWYEKEGTIFEFYDPFGKLSPTKIPRKDRFGAIKEFGWSAAIYIALSMMTKKNI